jgi:hypothetical protein
MGVRLASFAMRREAAERQRPMEDRGEHESPCIPAPHGEPLGEGESA